MPNTTHSSVAVLVSIIIFIIVSGYFLQTKVNQFKSNIPTVARAEGVAQITTPSSTPTPTVDPVIVGISEHPEIAQEIKRVFGKHADKAFKVLSCENAHLNPNAVHDNEKYGQGIGKDWGIFQINDKWQGVTNPAFLTDYKINIALAWNIYSRDGYSFKLWTCGRKFGL